MMDQLAAQHEQVKSQFEKLSQEHTQLQHVRVELDSLSKLGDMVSPEDVIKGAGNLVARGASPLEMAKLLSDLPEAGPQIQSWLQTHEQVLAQHEAALAPILAAGRHELATSAMRVLVGHALDAPQMSGQQNSVQDAAQAPSGSGGNALQPAAASQPGVQ